MIVKIKKRKKEKKIMVSFSLLPDWKVYSQVKLCTDHG